MLQLEHLALSISHFLQRKAVLVFLGSIITVLVCCIGSQCVVRLAKNYRLRLNRHYNKKRYEKAKMIQEYINRQEEAEIRRL